MSRNFSIRSLISFLSIAVALLLSLAWMPADGRRVIGQTGNQNLPVLELNQTVNSELPPGATQSYLVKIEAGTYVRFEATFQQHAAQMALYGSNGELFYRQFRDARKTSTGLWQRLGRVIENAGTYRLELSAKPEQKAPSSYTLKIAELRAATEDDRSLETAESFWQEADKRWKEKRDFDRAITLGEKSLAIFQKLSPQTGDPGNMAILLSNLYGERGYHRDTPRRAELIEIAIRNREELLGPYGYQVALLYEELAFMVDPVRAEKYLQKEMDILVRNLGNEHLFVANVLNVQANNADALGDRKRATEMYLRSIQMIEKLDGLESEQMISQLINLAQVRLDERNLVEAEVHLLRALKLAGPELSDMALFYSLAELYQRKGDFAQSDIYHQKLLEHHNATKKLPQNKDWAIAYQQMGNRSIARGKYEDAAKHFGQAQKVLEMTGDSPEFAGLLHDWRKLYLLTGRTNDAIAAQRRAVEISEAELKRSLAYGSETDKMKILSLAAKELAATLSLHIQSAPESNEAKHLAFTTLLQRKGRVMDEMNRTLALLRLSAKGQDPELIEQWMNKASRISLLASRTAENEDPAGQLAKIDKLNLEFEQLQNTISQRSAEFRAQVLPAVKLEDVRAELPPDSALIEFAQYEPEDLRTGKKSPARYLAYVLPKEGEVRGIELGEVATIDAAVRRLRLAITDKNSGIDPNPAARKLDELVMQPIRPLLGQATIIFLSPDGELNLAPFPAMRGEDKKYLIEKYLLIFLTSGRDLLRLKIKHENQPDKMIFTVSDFDRLDERPITAFSNSAQAVSDSRSGMLSSDTTMATMTFKPLGYAREEGTAIQKLFPQSKLYADGQATETLLKQVRRPYFLHLTTHGFFLPNSNGNKENALLRSGLAFAGANKRQSGKDDGFLTAFEAAALDLWGTKLVVLSACETGTGEIKTGEGVFGLRRALVLAGAETQVTSLWLADDLATRKLMESFYGKLRAGMGRAESLRQAQLEMLRKRAYSTPYFWANFICLGDWRPLEK